MSNDEIERRELERRELEAQASSSSQQFSSPTPEEMLAMGWPFIPVDPYERPLISWKPFQQRRPRVEEVEYWQKSLDPAGWAVVTGEISQFITFDFDGSKGAATMRKLGLLPHRSTPNDGFHFDIGWPGYPVLTLNSKSKKSLDARYPGMDVRGDGGYVVVAGQALINGSTPPQLGEYRWLRNPKEPLAPYTSLPEELLDFFGRARGQQQEPGPEPAPDAETGFNGQDTSESVDRELLISRARGMLGSMGRNDAGAWLAVQGRDNGYSKAEVLGFKWHSYCPATDRHGTVSPYTAGEWRATVESIFSRPPREHWGSTRNSTNQTAEREASGSETESASQSSYTVSGPSRQVHDWGCGQFELSERGVEYAPAPDKDGNPKPAIWLCSRLDIVAQTRDHQSSCLHQVRDRGPC